MNLRKLALAGTALAMMAGAPAQASIVDNPHFKVLGLVIVWSGDGAGGAIANDFVVDFGADVDLIGGAANDGNTVVTGTLDATVDSLGAANGNPFDVDGSTFTDAGDAGLLDAADSYSAFAIDNTTDLGVVAAPLETSFYVASNTGFGINGTATATTATGDLGLADIGYELGVTAAAHTVGALNIGGAAARVPSTNAVTLGVEAGFEVGGGADLADLTGAAIYTGDQSTAAATGTIIQQSARFDNTYTLGGTAGYDLSMGAGEVEAEVVFTVFVP